MPWLINALSKEGFSWTRVCAACSATARKIYRLALWSYWYAYCLPMGRLGKLEKRGSRKRWRKLISENVRVKINEPNISNIVAHYKFPFSSPIWQNNFEDKIDGLPHQCWLVHLSWFKVNTPPSSDIELLTIYMIFLVILYCSQYSSWQLKLMALSENNVVQNLQASR